MQHETHQKTSPWLIAFRVLFTAALLATILFIFSNSLEDGATSSARSAAVMQAVNALLGKVGLGPLSQTLIRKLAHFAEFMLEGFLLMLCLRVYTRHFVRHMSWPLLLGMGTALLDETIQRHIPSRSSSVVDVWIDTAGVVAGIFVALIILLIFRALGAFARIESENRALREEQEAYRREQEERRERLEQARREQEHERLARRAAQQAAQRAKLQAAAPPARPSSAIPRAQQPRAPQQPVTHWVEDEE